MRSVAAVRRSWRDALRAERAWRRVCTTEPHLQLLTELHAQPWCQLGWRTLFMQHTSAAALATRRSAEASGPIDIAEHFSLIGAAEPLPEGCVAATRRMVKQDGICSRLRLAFEYSTQYRYSADARERSCLLGGGNGYVLLEVGHEYDKVRKCTVSRMRIGTRSGLEKAPIDKLVFSKTLAEHRPVAKLETMSVRDNYKLRIGCKDSSGATTFTLLTPLLDLMDRNEENNVLARFDANFAGTTPDTAPCVSLSLVRVCDGHELCLTSGTHDNLNVEGNMLSNCIVSGTGRLGGLFNKVKLSLSIHDDSYLYAEDAHEVEHEQWSASVELPWDSSAADGNQHTFWDDPLEGYSLYPELSDFFVGTVENLLGVLECPAFAARWTPPGPNQQTDAIRNAELPLARLPRDAYRLGMVVYQGRNAGESSVAMATLADISLDPPKADWMDDDGSYMDLLVEHIFEDEVIHVPLTVDGPGSFISIELWIFRKRDSKALKLGNAEGFVYRWQDFSGGFKIETPDACAASSLRVSAISTRFEYGHESDTDAWDSEDDEADDTTYHINAIKVHLWSEFLSTTASRGEAEVCTVDGLLQMVESPSFAPEWV